MFSNLKLLGIKPRNGMAYVGLGLALFIGCSMVLSVFNIFTPLEEKNNLLDVFTGLSGGLMIFAIVCFFQGWTESNSTRFASFFAAKDLAYLGLNTDARYNKPVFTDGSLGKPQNFFFRWLSYPWTGKPNNKIATSGYFRLDGERIPEDHLTLSVKYTEDDFWAIRNALKKEKLVTRDLKRKGQYSKALFSTGTPLAAYILVTTQYADGIQRAIWLKQNQIPISKAYLMNMMSETCADLEALVDVPFSWMKHAAPTSPPKALEFLTSRLG